MSTRSLAGVLLVVAVMGCDEPAPPPPAIVGDTDAFTPGNLRPLHADADSLYFYYSATDLGGSVPGPDAGVYRVAVAGGEPTLLVETAQVLGVERAGDDLLIVTRDGSTAQLVTLPLDRSAPTSLPLTDGKSLAAVASSGATFVLAGDPQDGRMSITRLATESEPEQVFAVRERAFVEGAWFDALDGQLYWMEGDPGDTVRVADDQSQAEPDELQLPSLNIPTTGDVWDDRYRLLGTIDGELYGSVYFESFYATGGTYSNGDPKGYDAYGGGAVYTIADTTAEARLVAGDVVHAVIAGDTLYGQHRDGDIVRIDPATGETTTLAGHAPIFDMFTRLVVNDELLFYGDQDYADTGGAINAIRFVSLAARD